MQIPILRKTGTREHGFRSRESTLARKIPKGGRFAAAVPTAPWTVALLRSAARHAT